MHGHVKMYVKRGGNGQKPTGQYPTGQKPTAKFGRRDKSPLLKKNMVKVFDKTVNPDQTAPSG